MAQPIPRLVRSVLVLLGVFAAGCSNGTGAGAAVEDTAVVDDAALVDATVDATADTTDALGDGNKAAACVDAFGDALPSGWGRLDGTVVAVVAPGDVCPLPNNDHVIVEVEANGAVYRVVVNVLSTSGDPDVRFGELDHALVGPAFAEGFHGGAMRLDYAADLGLHAGVAPFTPVPMAQLVPKVVAAIDVGAPISAFAQGSGGTSVHDVHRYGSGADGALVLHPTSSTPHWLVFHFAEQTF